MADQTTYFSLFLPPKANNAGDPGKPLNSNFILIDKALQDIRTNYAEYAQPDLGTPLGAFAYDKIFDRLYFMASDGIKLLADFRTGTGYGGGSNINHDDVYNIASEAVSALVPDLVTTQLATELSGPMAEMDLELQGATDAKVLAIQAASSAAEAESDAIDAANRAMGYKDDAYEWSETASTQANLASGYANTADAHAKAAESSAGAAGLSAQSAEAALIKAQVASGNAKIDAESSFQYKEEAFAYKNDAEEAAGSAYQYSLNALSGAQSASGYAEASYDSSQLALTSSADASGYALSAAIASGRAENAAGQAEQYMLSVAEVSGDIQQASQSAMLSAQNASGYAEDARVHSVSASGYAQEASDKAELVAQYLSTMQSSGDVATEALVRATEDEALAKAITQAGTTYKGQTTLIQQQMESINGIMGTYAVKVNNNGHVAGFGLTSSLASGGNGVYSSFVVLADKFAVVRPDAASGETPTQIFVVDTDTGAVGINGSLVTGKIYSRNWGVNKGSYIDLDDGMLIFGGWDNPKLVIDEEGILHASGADISGKVTITDGSSGFHNLIDRPIFKGGWAPNNVEYRVGDEVTLNGSTWGSLITHTSDATKAPPTLPSTSNTYWTLRSQKGEQGEAYVVIIESTNGNIFKVGEPTSKTLIAHVFLNGAEVTDSISESRFKWRRVSYIQRDPPNDDTTWNNLYQSGYKQIVITTDSVYSRATYNCDIMSD